MKKLSTIATGLAVTGIALSWASFAAFILCLVFYVKDFRGTPAINATIAACLIFQALLLWVCLSEARKPTPINKKTLLILSILLPLSSVWAVVKLWGFNGFVLAWSHPDSPIVQILVRLYFALAAAFWAVGLLALTRKNPALLKTALWMACLLIASWGPLLLAVGFEFQFWPFG